MRRRGGEFKRVRNRYDSDEPKGMAVALRDGETVDSLMRRFKKMVESAGIMKELRKREYHLTRSQKRREKRKKAIKNLRKQEKLLS